MEILASELRPLFDAFYEREMRELRELNAALKYQVDISREALERERRLARECEEYRKSRSESDGNILGLS